MKEELTIEKGDVFIVYGTDQKQLYHLKIVDISISDELSLERSLDGMKTWKDEGLSKVEADYLAACFEAEEVKKVPKHIVNLANFGI